MDISDIPDLPISPLSSAGKNPRRRQPRGKTTGRSGKNQDKESTRPVDLQLSDEARIYHALRHVAHHALSELAPAAEDYTELLDARMDEWLDWTPEGAAAAIAAELRAIPPDDAAGERREPVRTIRSAFRDELDAIRRAGVASDRTETHLRETLSALLGRLSEDKD